MASDLSSGCTEVIEIYDEKEEGEISLEDVSSSEEGQLNDGSNSRRRAAGQCPSCLSTKHCASWCRMMTKRNNPKSLTKSKDTVQEKENCHHTKDSGYSGSKHSASTLQENNNDLIPISSDSDMEIVGLADSVKASLNLPQENKTKTNNKVRKRRRKRRSQNNSSIVDNVSVLNQSNITNPECSNGPKRDSQILKDNHLARNHRRESNSPHKISTSPFTRSRISKSPLRRHRSPFGRTRSPVLRKSPMRRTRSPLRRSPPLSPITSPARRQSRSSLSPSNHSVDAHGNLNKLLKKVRHLKAVGTHSSNRNSGKRRTRGPSLKDKLNNMMKTSDTGDETHGKSNSEKKMNENIDDEEDLALLRKMALETKPKRSDKDSKEVVQVKEKMQQDNNDIGDGDDDVEDLELRMIALRSAMLKKHKDRLQRGVVPGKTKKSVPLPRNNTESPFSQSFLDSIPIPGEDNEDEFQTPTLVSNENTNPEDMELDSEVELEKEKGAEPYSPTDDVSQEINIDSELLGIQPSDVSFITPASQSSAISNNTNYQSSESEKIHILEIRASYLPNNKILDNHNLPSSQSNYYSETNVLPSSQSPANSLYSLVTATEILSNNFSTQEDENLTATPYSPSQPIDTPKIYFSPQHDPFLNSDPNQIPDTPYSPTDTPIYDPELNAQPPVLFDLSPFKESKTLNEAVNKLPRDTEGKKWRKMKHERALIEIPLIPNLPEDIVTPSKNIADKISPRNPESSLLPHPDKMIQDKDNASESSSMKVNVGSAFSTPEDSPDSTMIVVDELPETDLDGSPLVPVSTEIRDIEIHIPATLSQETTKIVQEPLYLQGVPDVTKDANKIPTLVNRSLVPASILKSNKNLQQPLLPKKTEAHLEPAFKSAEMQPVQLSNETIKTNRLFKPIKLAPVIKKPQLRIVTAAAFNCSSNDNSVLEDQGEGENIKPLQVMSNIEAVNLLIDLQNGREMALAANKMWETTDLVQSENVTRIVQQMKALPLLISDNLTDSILERGINNDGFRTSNRKSADNVQENLTKEKKTRSRRSKSDKTRSKHATKTAKDDNRIETKDTISSISKITATEEIPCIDVSCIHKQTLLKDASQKTRNMRVKVKKPMPEKSKRDGEERRDRRSGHKYDKILNNHKNMDANKLDERKSSMKKSGGSPHALQSSSTFNEHRDNCVPQNPSMDVDNEARGAPNVHENTADSRRSDNVSSDVKERKSTELNKTENISNSSISCNVGISAAVTNINSQELEESTPDNVVCKKIQANKRRRSSYDDDEETLRAILLASLAKRSKPSDPAVNCTSKATALADLSHTPGNISTESVKDLPSTPGTKIPVSLVYSSSSDATPPSLSNDLSTLSHSSDKNENLGTLPQTKTTDREMAKNVISNNTTRDKIMPLIAAVKRKSISSSSKAPLKKIAKKVPISASTKVVNNAKKYQNTLVQKKLNLQKVATITNAQKTMNRTNLHNNKVMESGRTRSIITQPLSDTHRFVINLASDSESENETDTLEKNLAEPINSSKSDQKPILAIPMSDFEKSVDLFLKDVRKKQETAAAIKPAPNTNNIAQKPASPVTSMHRKSPVLSTTPLAVRHLPVSLQEEYRRLKQQILEREKLKLHRVLVNNISPLSPSSKSSGTPPGPLSPASPIASPTLSKQNHNTSPSFQPQIATGVKDISSRNTTVQSNLKNIVPNITARVNPVVSKTINPPISAVSNLSIQIPNETVNVSSGFKKSNNSYIPVSNSQARLVTAVKIAQETLNTKESKNSVVSVKDQLSLKNVQVQLQQGKTGRRVSLGENLNLGLKIPPAKSRETGAHESAAIDKIPVNVDSNCADKNVKDSEKIVDPVDIDKKCDKLVDSSTSTLIISREDCSIQNSASVDSSTSTIIISRNENIDSAKSKAVTSESSKVNSPPQKASSTGQKKLKNNTETWEKIRGDVRKELDSISALPSSEQKSYLASVEQNLVKKRYAILDDLSEISGNLRQLEMEREVQSNMASEVKKLQEQLKLAEERLQAQRSRVNKMVPNISAAYEKFNSGRRECVKMTRICLGLGCLVIGANYKIPAAGVQLLNDRLKQVAGSTRQLSSRKNSATGSTEKAQSGTNSNQKTKNSIEISLDSPQSDSTPSTINESCGITGSVTVIEDAKDSNNKTEFSRSVESEQTDIADEETLKLEERTVGNFAGDIPQDSPQQTSTPNSTMGSSSGIKNPQESMNSISTLVLDSPGAGTSGKIDSSEQRRFLEPYKSVLKHLTMPRTSDPSGILCPYELMGTCRDEDCQFVHQSARNGQ